MRNRGPRTRRPVRVPRLRVGQSLLGGAPRPADRGRRPGLSAQVDVTLLRTVGPGRCAHESSAGRRGDPKSWSLDAVPTTCPLGRAGTRPGPRPLVRRSSPIASAGLSTPADAIGELQSQAPWALHRPRLLGRLPGPLPTPPEAGTRHDPRRSHRLCAGHASELRRSEMADGKSAEVGEVVPAQAVVAEDWQHYRLYPARNDHRGRGSTKDRRHEHIVWTEQDAYLTRQGKVRGPGLRRHRLHGGNHGQNYIPPVNVR